MEQRLVRKVLHIGGMSCTSCEIKIENTLKKLEGIIEVKAIFSSSNVYITYDANVIEPGRIIDAIEELDYKVENKPGEIASQTVAGKAAQDKMSVNQLLGVGIIIFSLYVIIKNTVGFNFIPEVNQSMGYGIYLRRFADFTALYCHVRRYKFIPVRFHNPGNNNHITLQS
jgi:copper chaperone CopZ